MTGKFRARGFIGGVPDDEVAPVIAYLERAREVVAPEEMDYHGLLLALLLVTLDPDLV